MKATYSNSRTRTFINEAASVMRAENDISQDVSLPDVVSCIRLNQCQEQPIKITLWLVPETCPEHRSYLDQEIARFFASAFGARDDGTHSWNVIAEVAGRENEFVDHSGGLNFHADDGRG